MNGGCFVHHRASKKKWRYYHVNDACTVFFAFFNYVIRNHVVHNVFSARSHYRYDINSNDQKKDSHRQSHNHGDLVGRLLYYY